VRRSFLLLSIVCICALVFTSISVPVPALAQGYDCSKAPAPRLKVGTTTLVAKPTMKDISAGLLKAGPDRTGPVLRYLPLGTVVDVVEGPTCGPDQNNWWKVKLANLSGWIVETTADGYLLEPSTQPASTPLLSTVLPALTCIQFASLETAPGTPLDKAQIRLIYSTAEGVIQLSDDGGPGREITRFNPAPISLDLSPDGNVAAVATYNGVYWVDLATGNTLLLADSKSFLEPPFNDGLGEGAWPNRVWWMPDKNNIAVEIIDTREGYVSYAIWALAIDGSHRPFKVDTGAQPRDSVQRSPSGSSIVLISANDIRPFPKDNNDAPEALIEFQPRVGEGDANSLVVPTLSWTKDEKGFYTYIPPGEEINPTDRFGGSMVYVLTAGEVKDSRKLPRVRPTDYVIPSGDGEYVLVGRGAVWTIQSVRSGKLLQTLPPVQYLFGWTPDNRGIVFTSRTAEARYLGVDGKTKSTFVPVATDLYDIKWLRDGTAFFSVRGKDGKLSFKMQRPNEAEKFFGIIPTVKAFSAMQMLVKPSLPRAPQACK
jgi:hypothetical protein